MERLGGEDAGTKMREKFRRTTLGTLAHFQKMVLENPQMSGGSFAALIGDTASSLESAATDFRTASASQKKT